MTRRRDHCIRCGECCIRSSPTLQREDISLVGDGFIEIKALYTVRTGELVRDNVQNKLRRARQEMIKVREGKNGKGCIFYYEAEKACRIYEHRPSQCAALACWDPSEFIQVYARPRAQRRDIIQDRLLLELMDEHERRCGYARLEESVKKIRDEGETAVQRILEALKFDYHLRPFISEKLGINAREMDFIFGRPLVSTIAMFGLQIRREPDGSFLLTPA